MGVITIDKDGNGSIIYYLQRFEQESMVKSRWSTISLQRGYRSTFPEWSRGRDSTKGSNENEEHY